jgi:hypothetical protein
MPMQGNMPIPPQEPANLMQGQNNPESMNIGQVNPFA